MVSHPSKCFACDFQSEDSEVLNNHEMKEHMYRKCDKSSHDGKCKKICIDKVEHKCNTCKQVFETKKDIDNHNQNQCSASTHTPPIVSSKDIKCEECDFVVSDVKILVDHMIKQHRQSVETCNFCDYKSNSEDS